jgi:hypothetical protein
MVMLQREQVPLDRDVIFLAVSDEEADGTGTDWFIRNQCDLLAIPWNLAVAKMEIAFMVYQQLSPRGGDKLKVGNMSSKYSAQQAEAHTGRVCSHLSPNKRHMGYMLTVAPQAPLPPLQQYRQNLGSNRKNRGRSGREYSQQRAH